MAARIPPDPTSEPTDSPQRRGGRDVDPARRPFGRFVRPLLASRFIWVLVAIGVWSLVVVVGSGSASSDVLTIGIPDVGDLLVGAIILVAVVGWVILIAFRPTFTGGVAPREVKSLRTLVLLAVIVVMAAILFAPDEPLEEAEPVEPEVTADTQVPASGQGDRIVGGVGDADIVALLVLGVAAGLVALRFRRPTATAAPHVTSDPATPIEVVVEHSIHQLRSTTDPRMGVIRAYAHLEAALDENGMGRRRAETAAEHLRRVLADTPPLTEPGVRLGQLYEIARFSDIPITSSDREAASDALADAVKQLRQSSPS